MKRFSMLVLFVGLALILFIEGGVVLIEGQAPIVAQAPDAAQVPTLTPAPLSFPTQAPMRTPLNLIATSFPTFTPTVAPVASVRLREGSSEVNIRSEPDDRFENVIGQMRPDEEYTLTGIWYSWYQIAFGEETGYVFGSIVDVVGDIAQVPQIELATYTPALPPEVLNPTLTYETILNSEGGELTLTAGARQIDVPGTLSAEQILPGGQSGSDSARELQGAPGDVTREVLPTFTFPPNLVAQAEEAERLPEITTELPTTDTGEDGVAPIVPIAVLALAGVLFFLLGLLQR